MKICPTALRIVLTSITAAVGLGASQIVFADATNTPVPGSSGGGPTATAIVPGLPFGASEVVKMYQGGIGKDVIINYIDSASLPFHLSADNIIYLQGLGLPQEVTKAMIVRDGVLQQQAGLYAQQMAPGGPGQPPYGGPPAYGAPPPYGAPPQGVPPSQDGVLTPSTPPPAVVAAPGYDYGSAYYDGYPYYYGPSVVVGGWWPGYYGGWRYRGWYGGGFRGGFGGFRGGGGGFHGGGAVRGGGGGGFGGHGGGGGGGHR